MPDLIITDAAVLFPDGTVRGGRKWQERMRERDAARLPVAAIRRNIGAS